MPLSTVVIKVGGETVLTFTADISSATLQTGEGENMPAKLHGPYRELNIAMDGDPTTFEVVDEGDDEVGR